MNTKISDLTKALENELLKLNNTDYEEASVSVKKLIDELHIFYNRLDNEVHLSSDEMFHELTMVTHSKDTQNVRDFVADWETYGEAKYVPDDTELFEDFVEYCHEAESMLSLN